MLAGSCFQEGFDSWRRIIAGGGELKKRAVLFINAAAEVGGYVARGLDASAAADALTDLALAHGLLAHFGADGLERIISEAFVEGRQLNAREALGPTSSGSPAATGGRGQLNPAFSRWLMGYPPAWDACAATATPSSRRSPPRSSPSISRAGE